MTEQYRNVDESGKSPASKRRKHSKLSDDKLQHLTTRNNTSLETGVRLNRQER